MDKTMSNDTQDDQEGKINLDEIDADTATPEQVAEVINIAKTALVQRGKWKEQAFDPDTKKPYKELWAEAQKTPSPTVTPVATEQKPDIAVTVAELKVSEEKRDFQDEHHLTRAEADMVFAQAKGMGIKPAEALKTPFVEGGLKVLRDAQKASDATPRPSGRSPQVAGKPVSELTEEEQRKHWQEITGHKKA